MGVNYNQYCLVGIRIDEDDAKKIIKPAEYETQNRYDPRTGKVTNTVEVLVKDEQTVYEFEGFTYDDDFYGFIESLAKKHKLDYAVNEQVCPYGVVGFSLGTQEDYGRVTLLECEEEISDILLSVDTLKDIFPNMEDEIEIHFVTSVG